MDVKHGGRPADVFGGGGAEPGTRFRRVRLGLRAVAAVLAVRQPAAVLATPGGERLTDLETWVGPEGVLHVKGSLYDSTQFTGTPFGTLLLVVALGMAAARAPPSR